MLARTLLLASLGVTLTVFTPSASSESVFEVTRAEAQPRPKKAGRRAKSRRRRASPPPKAADPALSDAEPAPAAPIPFRGPTRIDFDDRLVQGQTNQSGAVVLFARKASGLRSMVDRRKSFRDRTLRTIFDR